MVRDQAFWTKWATIIASLGLLLVILSFFTFSALVIVMVLCVAGMACVIVTIAIGIKIAVMQKIITIQMKRRTILLILLIFPSLYEIILAVTLSIILPDIFTSNSGISFFITLSVTGIVLGFAIIIILRNTLAKMAEYKKQKK